MIAQQVAGKATRDALFLSNFDVTNLPKMVITAAFVSMGGVMLMSWLLSHITPAKLVPGIFGLSAILFIGEWVILGYQPNIASVILYLHMAVFGAILISGFWSIINERFDPHSAKQRVARIAAAATLGGVIGGMLADTVATQLNVRSMLLFLSGLHVICLIAVMGIGTQTRAAPVEQHVRTRSAFTIISHTPYLQWMALLMVLVAVMAALVDYAFKAEAVAHYKDTESLVAFFGSFYAFVGVLGFVLQTLLGRRILQRFGIGATIAILPAVVALFGVFGTAVTHLWTMIMMRGSHAVFVTSFFRSAFELLYTPLPPHKKRPTKTIIDVASDRLGDLIGSGFILLLLFLLPDLPTAIVAACAVLVAIVALYVITRLNRGYINQLASSLRKGVVQIEEEDIIDATTEHILAESNAYSERDFLQTKIDAMQERKTGEGYSIDEVDESASLADLIADLCSNDTNRIQHALIASLADIRLTPYMIPLLANDDIADDVRTELRWLVPRIPGQLTDALLDPDVPMLARQRLPGVLEASHNPRSIDGLLLGMMDASFNVRYSSARALARMRSRNANLKIPSETIYTAIHKELDVSLDEWEVPGEELNLGDEQVEDAGSSRINRNLEHVFTLLALTLDPDAVHMCKQAAFSKDLNLRGTALEYLENVLPAGLYQALVERLGLSEEERSSSRSLREVMKELKSVVQSAGPHWSD
ncbi:MAG: Npt1/Npt2 family nucleotide transporter [Gammaproteobacteria bacterium]